MALDNISDGQGLAFTNNGKNKPNQPDYKGQVKTPDGHTYDIALWIKEGRKGKFFSIAIAEPRQQREATEEFQTLKQTYDARHKR